MSGSALVCTPVFVDKRRDKGTICASLTEPDSLRGGVWLHKTT